MVQMAIVVIPGQVVQQVQLVLPVLKETRVP